MDITDIITTEFATRDGDAPASAVLGAIETENLKAVVVTDDDDYAGVITQRQLASGRQNPEAKARRLAVPVGRARVDDDVRRLARLMVGSRSEVIPVFDGEEFVGIVTATDLLTKVLPFLSVLSVDDACSRELETASPSTTIGQLLHTLRTERITHLPVVDGGDIVGIASLLDVVGVSTRATSRGQGGSPGEELQRGGGRSHGGFGERAGDIDRLLDLPVADVMTTPVVTVAGDIGLDEAVGRMLDEEISSLVVVDDGDPTGILTTTDALRMLTIPDDSRLAVQITNVDLLDDIDRMEVTDMISSVTDKYADLSVLETNVYLHEHDEKLRGTPLIMARIRLFTDKGHFVGTGEGYGASHALHLARNVLERQLLDGKSYAQTRKHADPEEIERMLGWWLTGSPRQR